MTTGRTWFRDLESEGLAVELTPAIRAGDGVFETMRTFGGRIFRPATHLARLREGATSLDLGELPSEATLTELVLGIVERTRVDPDEERVVRIGAYAGSSVPDLLVQVESRRLPSVRVVPPSSRVDTAPYPHPQRFFSGERSAPPKWAARGPLAHALRRSHRSGFDETLLVTPEGWIIEGSRSNLVVVSGGRLVAPGPSAGALPGVTRAAILEVASRLRLDSEDRPVLPRELRTASEAFLTSSLMGVSPVTVWSGHPIGGGSEGPGPVTTRIAAGYADLVEAECGRSPETESRSGPRPVTSASDSNPRRAPPRSRASRRRSPR